MSDVAKWAILISLVATFIVAVLTLPFAQWIDFGVLGTAFSKIAEISGNFMYNARAFINIFLFENTREMLSGLILYLFFSWILKYSIKFVVWVAHFIMK